MTVRRIVNDGPKTKENKNEKSPTPHGLTASIPAQGRASFQVLENRVCLVVPRLKIELNCPRFGKPCGLRILGEYQGLSEESMLS